MTARYHCTTFEIPAREEAEGGADIILGLNSPQKTLPCRYLYDDTGSHLFERICDTQEYYPTRTEEAILRSRAREIIEAAGHCELVELGSGAARKVRILLEALNETGRPMRYLPIDINKSAIDASAQELLQTYPELHIRGMSGTYERALCDLPDVELASRMTLFLGNTFGNFDDDEEAALLGLLRRTLRAGEYFLLGVDLHKDSAVLEAAYNDADGITAEFNRNLLRHVNRRFGGNFVLDRFAHQAIYNEGERRIEMHLKSLGDQQVKLDALDLEVSLTAGETIRTEISRKFELAPLARLFERHGFRQVELWTDPKEWFALILWRLE
jgi:dimethylhistidine N-methyltransferase